MKIAIAQPIDPQSVIPTLTTMLPGYKFSMRGKSILVCEKTGAVGATVFFRKNKLIVQGAFPSMGLQMVFVLSLVLLGILIPMLIFLLTVHKGQKASQQEVHAAMQAIVSGTAPQPNAGYPAVAQPAV